MLYAAIFATIGLHREVSVKLPLTLHNLVANRGRTCVVKHTYMWPIECSTLSIYPMPTIYSILESRINLKFFGGINNWDCQF